MDTVKFEQALIEAQAGLVDTEVEFEAIRTKREKLENTIDALRALLGLNKPEHLSLPLAIPVKDMILEKPALWAVARDFLVMRNDYATVPNIVDGLAAQGIIVQSDALRVAMIRKPDVFEKQAYGRYGLKSWGRAQANDSVIEDDNQEEAAA